MESFDLPEHPKWLRQLNKLLKYKIYHVYIHNTYIMFIHSSYNDGIDTEAQYPTMSGIYLSVKIILIENNKPC